MSVTKTLVLFTGSYPYESAAEHTFLDPEMAQTSARFDRIILVPANLGGGRRSIPANVEVEEGYANTWSKQNRPQRIILRALQQSLFWKEILRRFNMAVQPRALRKAMWIIANARFTRAWVGNFIRTRQIDLENALFYTYWLDHITLGIGLAKADYPKIRLVSRAHNYDIYEDRLRPPYIPFRAECLSHLDFLFPISENGRRYIAGLYPWVEGRCEAARLGVKPAGFVAQPSADGVFRVVSCSFLVPFKRVDLLCHSLQALAQSMPQQKVEWHHMGDGPLQSEIESLISKSPANLFCNLVGRLPNEAVMAFYRNHPVDLFVNVSEIEGIPVSIMEAQSCGIPVLATAVGGTPEVVNEVNGGLLPPDPVPFQIAEAMRRFLPDSAGAQEKREASLKNWRENYNAAANFQTFTERIYAFTRS